MLSRRERRLLRRIERRLDADEPDLARILASLPTLPVRPEVRAAWMVWAGIALIVLGILCAAPLWVLFGILVLAAFPVVVAVSRG
ncbi:MAG: DUF3040 domain-containing protein [Pseudonocardia sp.]